MGTQSPRTRPWPCLRELGVSQEAERPQMMTCVLGRAGLCELGGRASLGSWQRGPPGPMGPEPAPCGVPALHSAGQQAQEQDLRDIVWPGVFTEETMGCLRECPPPASQGMNTRSTRLLCPRLSNLSAPPLGEVTSPQRPHYPTAHPHCQPHPGSEVPPGDMKLDRATGCPAFPPWLTAPLGAVGSQLWVLLGVQLKESLPVQRSS